MNWTDGVHSENVERGLEHVEHEEDKNPACDV